MFHRRQNQPQDEVSFSRASVKQLDSVLLKPRHGKLPAQCSCGRCPSSLENASVHILLKKFDLAS